MPPIRLLPSRRSRSTPKPGRIVLARRSQDVPERMIIQRPYGGIVGRFEGDHGGRRIRLIDTPMRDRTVHTARGEDVAMYRVPCNGYDEVVSVSMA